MRASDVLSRRPEFWERAQMELSVREPLETRKPTEKIENWKNGPHALVHGVVREAFGYEFRLKSNEANHVLARHIAQYLTYSLFRTSLPEVGRYWGGQHHTTVRYGVRKIAKESHENKDLRELLERLRGKIAERMNEQPQLYAHRSLVAVSNALGRLRAGAAGA